MDRLFETPISTSNLFTPDFDRLCEIIDEGCDHQGNLIAGSLVARLERQLCHYHQSEYCVAFSTGFWALVAAVSAKALKNKPEVIIPSLTYRRLADVVHWAGKTPVLVDTSPDSLAVSCDAVTEAINESTSLILAVHPIVNCCDVPRLLAIAQESGIPILFDAVESVHETCDGQRIGSFGVGEVFSFHASKLINGGEGGYVCADDQVLVQKLREFRCPDPAVDSCDLRINSVLCDGHAALAIAGLESIEQNVAHNRLIYETYRRETKQLRGIEIVLFDQAEQTSWKNVVAEVTDDFCLGRDELVRRLNDQNILARAHYYPALHAKSYRYPIRRMDTPVADVAMTRFINLPCGQMVSPADVVRTCQFIHSLTT